MIKSTWKAFGIVAFFGMATFLTPVNAWASLGTNSGPGLSAGGYIVTVEAESVNINREHGKDDVLTKAAKGATYSVLEDMGDGWVKVKVQDTVGYLPVAGNASISAGEEELAEEAAADGGTTEVTTADTTNSRRQNLVNYALQFVGGRYRYGGNDPRTGVDCSGFTRYVMQHGAGVSLNRSSGAQATQGISVNSSQMRPGDLLFYASGRTINHVAMYIGNGQIVHASTYKTGIKISNWNYRTPVRIANVLGD